MPSERMLAAARDHFPANKVRTEKESLHADLTAANVLIQYIKERVPFDERDQEWHDLMQIHTTIGAAQRFTQ